jgi:hypothetical protein
MFLVIGLLGFVVGGGGVLLWVLGWVRGSEARVERLRAIDGELRGERGPIG